MKDRPTAAPTAAPAARPGFRDVLAVREFRALWFAHVASGVGDQVTRVALASLVLARTGSVALSAMSFTLSFLPWLVGGPVLGVLADRFPRRTVMVCCDIGRGVAVGGMAEAAVPVWGLFALGAVSALLAPPFEAARGATVPDVLTPEQYPVGQSLTMASLQVAQMLGFALGGLLVSVRPGAGVLLVDAATFLMSAAVLRCCCLWRPGRPFERYPAAGPVRSWLRTTAAGAMVVGSSVELRRLLLVCCVSAGVAVVPEGVAVAQARAWGVSALSAGLLCAALPAGTAFGAVALGRWVEPARRLELVRPLSLLACTATAATLLHPALPGTLALWWLAGVGAAGLLPANVDFVMRLSPAVRGRGLALAQVALQGAQGVALTIAGVLASRLGPAQAVGLLGVAGGFAVLGLSHRWPVALMAAQQTPGRTVECRRRPARAASAPVWVLAGLVLTSAWFLWTVEGPVLPAPPGPLRLAWWSLLPLVLAAQAGVVHFQVRRQAQTVTLCHLPIVLGLLCCPPGDFVVARVVGGLLGMALLRRQRGIKLVLNTASYTLEAVIAVVLLDRLRGWPLPAAMYLVMVVADLTSFTVVSLAITLFERRARAANWLKPLAWLLPINLVATSVALLAAAALWRGLGYLPLLVGVLTGLLLFYRTYSRLRDRHVDLGQLKDLAASLPPLLPGGPELAAALEDARVLLLAETLELWLPHDRVVLAVEGQSPEERTASSCVRAPAPTRDPSVRGRAAWLVLAADLSYDGDREHASLVARGRLGAVRKFDHDDDQLLAAVGALIAGGLGRGQDRQRALDAAGRDPLTGLWTLPEAARRASQLLASNRRPGLLIIDIIGLQDVNDSLGHDAGDALLALTARRLRDACGSDAITARIGGDEFLAVLDQDGPRPEDIVKDLGGQVELAGPQIELRVRAGYAGPDDREVTFQRLLRQAQAALARASRGGRRYRVWTPELAIDPSRRLRLASDLQGALATGAIAVVFQPLCRAADLAVVGAEALARWHHPTLGQVSPDEFIALAEQTGLISELTLVVLHAALRQARAWRDAGKLVRVSVNLSPRSLADPGLVTVVAGALSEHGLPAAALLLEITENSIMDDLAHGLAVLRELRAAGVEIAIDDFGTGHSSLAHLRTIPAGEVKLDRSLLAGITSDPTARKVVRTAVGLCHDLGKAVVAEGVEDAETADLLRACGVDLLQGYHLGRPLPAAQWDPRLLEPDPTTVPRRAPHTYSVPAG